MCQEQGSEIYRLFLISNRINQRRVPLPLDVLKLLISHYFSFDISTNIRNITKTSHPKSFLIRICKIELNKKLLCNEHVQLVMIHTRTFFVLGNMK